MRELSNQSYWLEGLLTAIPDGGTPPVAAWNPCKGKQTHIDSLGGVFRSSMHVFTDTPWEGEVSRADVQHG